MINSASTQSIVLLIYRRYKDILMPLLIIVICALVFLVVVIPQIQLYFEKEKEAKLIRERIEVLNKNLAVVSGIQDDQQEYNFQLALAALPVDKDFVGIISAINQASAKTGIVVDDYQFQVGALATDSARSVPDKLLLTFSLDLQAGTNETRRFVPEFYKTLPLSRIDKLDVQTNFSGVGVSFYYKPVPLDNFNFDIPLVPLSQKENKLLDQLTSYQSNL